jgi:hypothetical protein
MSVDHKEPITKLGSFCPHSDLYTSNESEGTITFCLQLPCIQRKSFTMEHVRRICIWIRRICFSNLEERVDTCVCVCVAMSVVSVDMTSNVGSVVNNEPENVCKEAFVT